MILKIISPFAADPRSTLFSCPEVPKKQTPRDGSEGCDWCDSQGAEAFEAKN